jgi:hypothetical protein
MRNYRLSRSAASTRASGLMLVKSSTLDFTFLCILRDGVKV